MKKYCVYEDYTLKEVIDRIDDNKDRVAVVLNSHDKVIGVVSQGDIIRALTGGHSLYSRVENIIKPSFLYINAKDMEKAWNIFRKTKITMLPVVDENYHLTGIINLNDIYSYLEQRNNTDK